MLSKFWILTFICFILVNVYVFLQFSSEDIASKVAHELVEEYSSVIFGLVGFYLDRPLNMAGNTGWETITEAA